MGSKTETTSSLSEDAGDSGGSGTIARDQIFEVLSNERRQHILEYLKRNGEDAASLRELVDYVAAAENDTTVEDLDSAERKCVYTALRQSHLPKLDECNVVRYDQRRGEVELTDDAREVQMYLEYVPEHDIPWCYYYLGLTAILGSITGLVLLDVYPFAGLSNSVLVAMIIGAFGLSAVIHTIQTRRNELGRGTGLRS